MKRLLACWLGLAGVVAVGADASSDPFATQGGSGGFSTKNPNFARYAASAARGFDRTGREVTVEIIHWRGPLPEGASWPDEPEAEWLEAEPPQRISIPLKLFHANWAKHGALTEHDPDGRLLPEPVFAGVFAGVYVEPASEEADGAYAVELFFSRAELKGWHRDGVLNVPIRSSLEVNTRLTAGNRWLVFGGTNVIRRDDGAEAGRHSVLYLRVADGLPPLKDRPVAQEPTTITPPAR